MCLATILDIQLLYMHAWNDQGVIGNDTIICMAGNFCGMLIFIIFVVHLAVTKIPPNASI